MVMQKDNVALASRSALASAQLAESLARISLSGEACRLQVESEKENEFLESDGDDPFFTFEQNETFENVPVPILKRNSSSSQKKLCRVRFAPTITVREFCSKFFY